MTEWKICSSTCFSSMPNWRTMCLPAREASMTLLILFDGHHQTVGLNLLVIKLGFLSRRAGNETFAIVVNFQHVLRGFLAIETKNAHKHEHDVGHEIDRIVPDNHVPAFLESFFNLLFRDLNCLRQCFDWHICSFLYAIG